MSEYLLSSHSNKKKDKITHLENPNDLKRFKFWSKIWEKQDFESLFHFISVAAALCCGFRMTPGNPLHTYTTHKAS